MSDKDSNHVKIDMEKDKLIHVLIDGKVYSADTNWIGVTYSNYIKNN